MKKLLLLACLCLVGCASNEELFKYNTQQLQKVRAVGEMPTGEIVYLVEINPYNDITDRIYIISSDRLDSTTATIVSSAGKNTKTIIINKQRYEVEE